MVQSCFLCKPDQRLIYEEDSNLYAMLGLGPIVEGYSLLATKDHVPSMLDLTMQEVEHFFEFTQLVRRRLIRHYGEVIITEHGRVPLCEYRDKSGHESHCFHAHRLIFPLSIDLSPTLNAFGLRIQEYESFIEARKYFDWKGEYLYYERPDGSCLLATSPRRIMRQFFRYQVAAWTGHPEFASWRRYPQLEVIEAARTLIMNKRDLSCSGIGTR